MVLIHRPRGETALKQVAGDPRPRVGEGGEAPVRLADRLGEPAVQTADPVNDSA